VASVIDCDVRHSWASPLDVFTYLPSGWRECAAEHMTRFAILAALRTRGQRGGDQVIDLSLYDQSFACSSPTLASAACSGSKRGTRATTSRTRCPVTSTKPWEGSGSRSPPRIHRVLERLAASIGYPELIEDPRFRDNATRVRHRDALDETRGLDRSACVVGRARPARGGGRRRRPRIRRAPHPSRLALWQRDDIGSVADPDVGMLEMPGVIRKFSDPPGTLTHTGRSWARITEKSYGGWLGLNVQEVDRLRAEEVI